MKEQLRRWLIRLMWAIGGAVISLRYKVIAVGTENIPRDGAVLLLGNHVSWLDWILIQLPLRRLIRYVMDKDIYEWKAVHWMFRLGRTIPISARASKGAFVQTAKALDEGELVVLFPEGGISRRCQTEKFYRGFEIIAQRSGTGVIVPFWIEGMCGSRWSYAPGHFTAKRSLWRRCVTIIYGEPMSMDSSADAVRSRVVHLKDTLAEQA